MTHDDGDALSIEFTTGIEENAALLRFVSRSPARIALQALIFAGVGLYLLIVLALVGIVFALFNSTTGRLAAVADYLSGKVVFDLVSMAPWIGSLCLGVFLLNLFVLVPRQCRLLARRGLSFYPEIRRDDPTMTLTTRLRVTPRGLDAATRDERVFMSWLLIQKLVERRHTYYLMTGRSTAFILPKTALAGEIGSRVLDAIRQALATLRNDAR